MNKWIILPLALTAFLFVGCGSQSDSAIEPETISAKETATQWKAEFLERIGGTSGEDRFARDCLDTAIREIEFCEYYRDLLEQEGRRDPNAPYESCIRNAQNWANNCFAGRL